MLMCRAYSTRILRGAFNAGLNLDYSTGSVAEDSKL